MTKITANGSAELKRGRNPGTGPSLQFMREMFTLHRDADVLKAEDELAAWIIRHSRMMNYDGAHKRDAVLLAKELLNTNPKHLSAALRRL